MSSSHRRLTGSSRKANIPDKDDEPPNRNVRGKERMCEEEEKRGKRNSDEKKQRVCKTCGESGHIAKVFANHSVLMHAFPQLSIVFLDLYTLLLFYIFFRKFTCC